MKTKWDYSQLAKAYVSRPNYSEAALNQMIQLANIEKGEAVCDVGAGVAHLTIPLLERGFQVVAVEPNDEMRLIGRERTNKWDGVSWFEGTGEETGQKDGAFSLVTFGSSFNVTDRECALRETARILRPNGWFACMWNHRDLENPLQKVVEEIIFSHVPSYSYGSRREDQTAVIKNSGLFADPTVIEASIVHLVPKDVWVEAWASHATLERQAGEKFEVIVEEIERYVDVNVPGDQIEVPYNTKIWVSQKIV